MSYNYIYIVHPGEYKKLNKNIYKIGKTTQINWTRVQNYKDNSELIMQVKCINCHTMETKILNKFKQKYKKHSVGHEYFIGNVEMMQNDIYELLAIENNEYHTNIQAEIIEINRTKLYTQLKQRLCNIYDKIDNNNQNKNIDKNKDKIIENTKINNNNDEKIKLQRNVEYELTSEIKDNDNYCHINAYIEHEKNICIVKCTKCNIILPSLTKFKTHLTTRKHIFFINDSEPNDNLSKLMQITNMIFFCIESINNEITKKLHDNLDDFTFQLMKAGNTIVDNIINFIIEVLIEFVVEIFNIAELDERLYKSEKMAENMADIKKKLCKMYMQLKNDFL